eukprot:TRINITY_DN47_c0_g1_i1.p1 TRINITY_DN47_c0_g1~~TRINITY_DN47_c0_g1_i1.p1  ORF type:complete len:580 (+),score=65.15 TRINITY_DN47_c0_g1_i1:41-1741(+)
MKTVVAFTLLGTVKAFSSDPCASLTCRVGEVCVRSGDFGYCAPFSFDPPVPGSNPCMNPFSNPCGPHETCVQDADGSPYCVPFAIDPTFGPEPFNPCTDPFSNPCGPHETCVQDADGSPYCVPFVIDPTPEPFNPCKNPFGSPCGPNESCFQDADGSPYCVPFVIDPTIGPEPSPFSPCTFNKLCLQNERCVQGEDGEPFCIPDDTGFQCGDVRCASSETCVDGGSYYYCDINMCDGWYCPVGEVCQLDALGSPSCVGSSGTQCGDFWCNPSEACMFNDFGKQYCSYQYGICGDRVCLPSEKCIIVDHYNPEYNYCAPADICDNWSCSQHEVCINDEAGFPKCVSTGRRTFRGSFEFSNCWLFTQNNIESLLTRIIRDIVKDEFASINYDCGLILDFLVDAEAQSDLTAEELQSQIEAELTRPELWVVLGSSTTVTELSVTPTEYCYRENGKGVLSDGVCFLTSCFYGFHVQSGAPGFVCVPDTSDDNNNNNNGVVIIILVSVIGALLVAMIIGIACCCSRTQQTQDQTTPNIVVPAVPVVVAPPKDPFPEKFAAGFVEEEPTASV